MEFSEVRKLEMGIGFTWGILIGAALGWLALTFLSALAWYYKLFSTIGSLGIIGSLILSLSQQVKARRDYLEVLKEMEKTNEKAETQLKELKGGQIKKNGNNKKESNRRT